MTIERSIDIEDAVRAALSEKMTVYCRPLPAEYGLPHILVTQVGGRDANKVDTFEVTLDARAETEAEALEYLRNAIGLLKTVAANQKTALRHVTVNSSGSWGNDPVRPDLAMCTARLSIVAHLETTNI